MTATDVAAAADAPPAGKDGSKKKKPSSFPRLPPPPPRDQLFLLASSIPVSCVEGEDAALRALKAGDLLRPVWLEQEEEEDAGEEGAEEGAPLVGLALAGDDADADGDGDQDSPPRVVATLRATCQNAAEALVSLCRPVPSLKGAARGVVRVSEGAASSQIPPSSSSSSSSAAAFSVSVALTPAALADAVTQPDEGYAETQFGRQLLSLLRWLKGEPFAMVSSSTSSSSATAATAAPSSSSSPPSTSSPSSSATLNAASLFEAIRPPRDAPRVRGWESIRGLAPALRPYQARAVGWMRRREAAEEEEEEEQEVKEDEGGGGGGGGGARHHPLWERVWEEGDAAPAVPAAPAAAPAAAAPASRRRGKATRGAAAGAKQQQQQQQKGEAPPQNTPRSIFVNRVTGRVSLEPFAPPPRVRGGILADEMGLGKTVELLALILKQRQEEEEEEKEEEERKRRKRSGGGRGGGGGRGKRDGGERVRGGEQRGPRARWTVRRAERERAERVECPCGARGPASLADDPLSSAALGLPPDSYWIQCDECDAWCHSACCGLSQRRRPREADGWACGGCLYARAAEVVVDAGDSDDADDADGKGKLSSSPSSSSSSGPSTTLIVCPTHIVGQWASELQRHAEPGALRVVVYEGQGGSGGGGRLVSRGGGDGAGAAATFHFAESLKEESGAVVLGGRDGGVVGAGDLAAADVVVVSYETLAREVHRSAAGETGDAVVVAASVSASSAAAAASASAKSLRAPKRYAALPTPLTRLVWGRAVLDEAQEVESGTTGAAALASRLAARRRWAVTGTPCGAGGTGGVDDLFGLFAFLRAEPWGFSQRVWREGLVRPAAAAWGSQSSSSSSSSSSAAAKAARDRLLAAMAPARGGLLWRSSKADVAGELRLPPQRQASTALALSAVERHFYDLAHDRTARWARSVPSSRAA